MQTMDPARLEMSRVIDASAPALARWTAMEMHERRPGLAVAYGPGSREAWAADVEARLAHLADAVAADEPALFVEHAMWSKIAFAARGRPVADVVLALETMRSVLRQELPDQAADAAATCIGAAIERLPNAPTESPTHIGVDQPHAELAARLLGALLEGDRAGAARLTTDAMEGGTPLADLYTHVFEPVLREVGRMWQMDEIGVAEEHFCTSATRDVMAQARLRLREAPVRDRSVVTTAVAGDLHELGARMVADFFELAGWTTRHLGANTPTRDLLDAMRLWKPDVLAVSTQGGGRVRAAAELVAAVRADPAVGGTIVLIGGTPFARHPNLIETVGADGSASAASEAVGLAEELLGLRGAGGARNAPFPS